MLIIGGSGSVKTNALINQQPDIDKMYLCAKDPFEEHISFYLKNKKVSA